ncbi:MAG TPA: universal stress protein [Chloroflexota bacterium]|nr:universal stress protein [Chloroflexota bacterium]
MFHSILVPLDGSADSAAALPVARTLASAMNNTVHLLRVVPTDSLAEASQATSYLAEISQELTTANLSTDSTVGRGEPSTEILKFARARDVDLIVMSTHARGSRCMLALTSVARQVLTESPAPVLMVRPDGRGLHRIRKLLVPVDGSPGGSLALAAAAWLCRRTGASIVLLDVVVPVPVDAFADMPALSLGAYLDPVWEELALRAARSYIDSLERRLTNVGLACEARVAAGEVASEIIRAASDVGADLVVMSTHSIAWPGQAYLGSVADGVVAASGRPVLLLRREPAAGESATTTAACAANRVPV